MGPTCSDVDLCGCNQSMHNGSDVLCRITATAIEAAIVILAGGTQLTP